MANLHSPQLNEHLEDEYLETAAAVEEDEETGSEEEETETEEDDDDDDETEEEEEEELITAVGSPSRVWNSDQLRNGDGENRRREEREGEACSVSGIESGNCSQSQGSDWNRCEIDGLFCPICMEAWTNTGVHQISCLPCGHIYGFSCIKRWLEQCQSSRKCPQCNWRCSLKDVRKLFDICIQIILARDSKRIRPAVSEPAT